MKLFRRTFSIGIFIAALSFIWAAKQTASPATRPTSSSSKNATAASSSAQVSPVDAAFAPESANSNQELTHAANEAAGRTPHEAEVGGRSAGSGYSEDQETAAFKYSPAVRGISKLTGLSLESAYWLCVVINFAIIAGLIVMALKSNLPAMFRGRTQEIQKGMEDARRASEEAQRKLQEIEARLSRMNVEISEMQKHAELEAKTEEERIRASIEEEKHKILQSAQHEVGRATSAARRELQKYGVELAVAMAEKGIRVEANEDKALVEDFAEQLASEARRNGSS
ncbi:MAG TPA: ATP synthase F0 subunit B [Terriglobales bacterium]|nr:ATP synthase F0 subunit B [Terriglobales bacterium]